MDEDFELGWALGFVMRDSFDELVFLSEERKPKAVMGLATTLYGDARAAAIRGITAAEKMRPIFFRMIEKASVEDWRGIERDFAELKKIARALPR